MTRRPGRIKEILDVQADPRGRGLGPTRRIEDVMDLRKLRASAHAHLEVAARGEGRRRSIERPAEPSIASHEQARRGTHETHLTVSGACRAGRRRWRAPHARRRRRSRSATSRRSTGRCPSTSPPKRAGGRRSASTPEFSTFPAGAPQVAAAPGQVLGRRRHGLGARRARRGALQHPDDRHHQRRIEGERR